MLRSTSVHISTGNPPVIELTGEVDFEYADKIRQSAREVISRGETTLHIGCTDLTFMDSSGLSALLYASKLASESNGRVCLLCPPEQLVRVLTVTGLDTCFDFMDVSACGHEPEAFVPDHWKTSRYVVSARLETVADLRHKVAILADTMGFTVQQIEDIRLSVGEATSNAVRHGSPRGELNKIMVQCERFDDRFVVQITDEGQGFDPEDKLCGPSDELAECGRGLLFMKLLMDDVSFSFNGGTTVRLEKRLQPDTAAQSAASDPASAGRVTAR